MNKIYLIAEIGINHEGDIDKCCLMIEQAAEAGASAVKLQTVNADKSYLTTSPSYNIFKSSELSKENTAKAFNLAKKLNIDIFTTVADEETANWVKNLNPTAWKVSSGLLNHTPLISYLCKLKGPIYLSTGMAFSRDIDNAIELIKASKKTCTLFQCTSEYPLVDKNINLGAIEYFKKKYHVEVGYSDHSIGNYICNLAAAAGATKIEKHFTFDNSRSGYDHSISSNKLELSNLVSDLSKIREIFGVEKKIESKAILLARKNFLRYLVASKDLEKDTILSAKDVEVKRVAPGEVGLEPINLEKVIGSKLEISKLKDEIFRKKDFNNLK